MHLQGRAKDKGDTSLWYFISLSNLLQWIKYKVCDHSDVCVSVQTRVLCMYIHTWACLASLCKVEHFIYLSIVWSFSSSLANLYYIPSHLQTRIFLRLWDALGHWLSQHQCTPLMGHRNRCLIPSQRCNRDVVDTHFFFVRSHAEFRHLPHTKTWPVYCLLISMAASKKDYVWVVTLGFRSTQWFIN